MGNEINGYGDAVDITPHASNEFSEGPCRAIYIGGGGRLAAVTEKGQSVAFESVQAGTVLPLRLKRVDPETTAEDLVALY